MRSTAISILIGSVSLSQIAGCSGHEVARVDPERAIEEKKLIPVQVRRDLDILFVIDNSQSMAEEQASLVANFPRFMEIVENVEGGLPSIHIGVISTDMGAVAGIDGCDSRSGDNGTLQSTPRGACEPPTGAFIRDELDERGNRIRNYPEGKLAETFSCIAALGTSGCGFEQPLEAMRRALEGNPGFLRDHAFLAVIFLTDEDDCSTHDRGLFASDNAALGPLSSFRCFEYGVSCEGNEDPRAEGPRTGCVPRDDSPYMESVDSYVAFLKGLKDDDGKILVAGIMGNPVPVAVTRDDVGRPLLEESCRAPGSDAGAMPPVRLQYFLKQFPQRNTFTTICAEDLREGLVLIAGLAARIPLSPCLEGNIDLNPETPEIEYDCQVSDLRYANTADQEETMIPACRDARDLLPCWRIEQTNDCSESEQSLAIFVERGGTETPDGTEVQVRCAVR